MTPSSVTLGINIEPSGNSESANTPVPGTKNGWDAKAAVKSSSKTPTPDGRSFLTCLPRAIDGISDHNKVHKNILEKEVIVKRLCPEPHSAFRSDQDVNRAQYH
ncbi:hypothetical protein ACEPPN_004620 [Leptodophora sp. 'Broadleaf-Isolate-01']